MFNCFVKRKENTGKNWTFCDVYRVPNGSISFEMVVYC
jgi:hypothetical protein